MDSYKIKIQNTNMHSIRNVMLCFAGTDILKKHFNL